MRSVGTFLIGIAILFSFNSYGQNLNGTWTGWLTQGKDTFDLMLEITQETTRYNNATTVHSNAFSGRATMVAKDQKVATLFFTGKLTMKGIVYEEKSLEPFSSLETILKKSRLSYNVTENGEIEILSGSWTPAGSSASCSQCLLYATKSTKKVIKNNLGTNNERPISTSQPTFEAFEVELISDSSGKVLEAQNRKVKTGNTIHAPGQEVSILLFDGRKEDGDRVSIILNNKVILYNYRVSKNPYKLKLPLDKTLKSNSLVFYAENLGDIPPNTCVISVIIGNQKSRDIQMESDLNSSDVLYILR